MSETQRLPTRLGTTTRADEVPCSGVPAGLEAEALCIPGGFSILGDPGVVGLNGSTEDAVPLRPVLLRPFAIDRHEMTVGRFRALINDGAPLLPPDEQACPSTWISADDDANDALPLTCVPVSTAEATCRELGGALPTEAQWEHAATGRGERRPFVWGGMEPSCCFASHGRGPDAANATPCGWGIERSGSHPAGASCPIGDVSRDGVVDLAGSVSELMARHAARLRRSVLALGPVAYRSGMRGRRARARRARRQLGRRSVLSARRDAQPVCADQRDRLSLRLRGGAVTARGHRRRLAALLCSQLLGCGGEALDARPQWLIRLGTDAPVPQFGDRVLIEILDESGALACGGCSRQIGLSADTAWPLSFGIDTEDAPLIIRVRLYRTTRTDASGLPTAEGAIDALGRLSHAPSGVEQAALALPMSCFGVPADPLAATSCDPVSGMPAAARELADEALPRPGSWPPAAQVPCPLEPDEGMTCVPGGAFLLGGDATVAVLDEQRTLPEQLVQLPPFAIDTDEVTVEQIRGLRNEGKLSLVPQHHNADENSEEYACTYLGDDRDDNDALPIGCVSWALADAACRAMHKRLPTEAEWEWAAGNLTLESKHPWLDDAAHPCEMARVGVGRFANELPDTLLHSESTVCRRSPDDWLLEGPPREGDENLASIRALGGSMSEWTADAFIAYSDPACWAAGRELPLRPAMPRARTVPNASRRQLGPRRREHLCRRAQRRYRGSGHRFSLRQVAVANQEEIRHALVVRLRHRDRRRRSVLTNESPSPGQRSRAGPALWHQRLRRLCRRRLRDGADRMRRGAALRAIPRVSRRLPARRRRRCRALLRRVVHRRPSHGRSRRALP